MESANLGSHRARLAADGSRLGLEQLWVPIQLGPSNLVNRESHNLQGVVARLKPGVTLAQAQSQMDGIARRLAEWYPRSNTGVGVSLVPLRDLVVGNIRRALWILFGAVGLILLMVSANVANLLLARQLLTESLLLVLVGGALGVLLAAWGVRMMLRFTPPDLPLFGSIGVHGPVLVFSLLVTVMAGLVLGIHPALTTSRGHAQEGLKEGAPQVVAGSRHTMTNPLMVVEIALGVIVLAGAGLLLHSFLLLEGAPLGFHPEGLLTFRVIPRAEKYAQLSRRLAFYQEALGKMRSLPGVDSAAAVAFLPLTFFRTSRGLA